jgi:hypothetical protein
MATYMIGVNNACDAHSFHGSFADNSFTGR